MGWHNSYLLGPPGLMYQGVQDQSDAAQQIAQAQLATAQANKTEAMGYAKQGQAYAAPTLDEIKQMDLMMKYQNQTYQLQNAALQRDQNLLSTLDPAFMEAGNQAYQMMKGQEATALAPMRAQRQLQRSALQDTLASSFGSGYATSSAGIDALNKFDLDTSSLLSSTQMNMMNSFLNTALGAKPNFAQDINQAGSTMAGMGMDYAQLAGSLQQRQMAGYGGLVQATLGTNLTQYAGAQYIQQLSQGQAAGNLGSQMLGMGGNMIGQYTGSGGGRGASTYTPSSQSTQSTGGGNGGSGGGGAALMSMLSTNQGGNQPVQYQPVQNSLAAPQTGVSY